MKECPLGMFADKTGRCQLCSLVCDGGCVGVATNCTSCKGEDLPFIYFKSEADLKQMVVAKFKPQIKFLPVLIEKVCSPPP